jgi:hypothetical protein
MDGWMRMGELGIVFFGDDIVFLRVEDGGGGDLVFVVLLQAVRTCEGPSRRAGMVLRTNVAWCLHRCTKGDRRTMGGRGRGAESVDGKGGWDIYTGGIQSNNGGQLQGERKGEAIIGA